MGRKGMTRQKLAAARLLFEGNNVPKIAECLFDITDEDGKIDRAKADRAQRLVHVWMEQPDFIAAYKRMQMNAAMPRYSKAMKVFDKQMDDANPWVAQGAAREIANRFGPMIMGENERQVTVRIEGMPEIGVPDDDA